MPLKKKALYTEKDSPFFRLRTKKKLAELLFTNIPKLKALTRDEDLYLSFQKPKKNGGLRQIEAPRRDLKRLQKRVADLLQRIAPPDYLFAPVGGRSYVDNAGQHLNARTFRLLDLEDFFPSCTADRVIWLFRTRFECSIDVAAILRAIVTRNGHLPQGSPCSPILAYLSYVDMWEEIEILVKHHGCKLSVYADDITVSGHVVPEFMIWQVKQVLFRFGHRISRKKERSLINKPVLITGAIVRGGQLHLPNRQHKKMHEIAQKLKAATSSTERIKLQAQLRGHQTQMAQVKAFIRES